MTPQSAGASAATQAAANAWIETVLVGAFLFLFTAYHIYLSVRARTRPLTTTIGQNFEMRKVWCMMMMANPSKHITAVQTIRNGMMASSLLASTSIALNTATFVFLVNYENIPGIIDLNVFGTDRIKPAYKLLALTICFLFSFFCYMQSIRMTNHASYQISLAPGDCRYVDIESVADNLNSSANFFTLGTRGYFLAFMIILWLFGPLPPLLGTLCLLPVLYFLDISAAKRNFNRTATAYVNC